MNKLDEIFEAICMYTESGFIPNRKYMGKNYGKLAKNLETWDCCAFEFCFFISFFKRGVAHQGPYRLKFTNMLNAESTWKEYIKFSKTRSTQIKTLAKLAEETFENNVKVYNDVSFVLHSIAVPLNSVFRVEYALKHKLQDIVDEYIHTVEYIVMGCPEYLKYCPLVKEYLID